MSFRDYYNVLGVEKSASEKDIKKAYRKLANEYHPDKTKGNKGLEEKFKEISEAYRVLGNAARRKQYDELGADWEQFQQSGANYEDFVAQKRQYQQYQNAQRKQQRKSQTTSSDHGGYSDFFEAFFGGGQNPFHEEAFWPGADVSGELTIDFMEAYTGTERILDIDGNQIKLKIKPGAYDGLQLKARGKGQKGSAGQAGDLYIKVRVNPHPLYKRKGDNLYMDHEVDLFDALLGGKSTIISPSGKLNITLKEGTQNGKVIRLKGKGMPVYGKANQFGDLMVTLQVKLPTQLTTEQKELIRQARTKNK